MSSRTLIYIVLMIIWVIFNIIKKSKKKSAVAGKTNPKPIAKETLDEEDILRNLKRELNVEPTVASKTDNYGDGVYQKRDYENDDYENKTIAEFESPKPKVMPKPAVVENLNMVSDNTKNSYQSSKSEPDKDVNKESSFVLSNFSMRNAVIYDAILNRKTLQMTKMPKKNLS